MKNIVEMIKIFLKGSLEAILKRYVVQILENNRTYYQDFAINIVDTLYPTGKDIIFQ